MIEIKAYVRKLPNGKWRVYSHDGKNLGTFNSEKAARKHLREIEFFKHKGSLNDEMIESQIYSTHEGLTWPIADWSQE